MENSKCKTCGKEKKVVRGEKVSYAFCEVCDKISSGGNYIRVEDILVMEKIEDKITSLIWELQNSKENDADELLIKAKGRGAIAKAISDHITANYITRDEALECLLIPTRLISPIKEIDDAIEAGCRSTIDIIKQNIHEKFNGKGGG